MKTFKTLLFSSLILVVLLLAYVTYMKDVTQTTPNTPTEKKPVVCVSSFALFDALKHIAKERIELVNILPFGVDPHSFEPTPKLMGKVEKSALVFYSGAGLEPWTDGFVFKNRAIEVAEFVRLRKIESTSVHHEDAEDAHHDEDEHRDEHPHHEHTGVDPHFWLDFANMKEVAALITQELSTLLPAYAQEFNENKKAYVRSLDLLQKAYKSKLSQCKIDTVVVNHNAIGYLADNYGFKVVALSGLSSEAQPSPKDLTRVFQEIKKDHINTLFFENFVNSKVIERVAKDSGISLKALQTLGNITADEAKAGATYETLMYENLTKLSEAMVCN